MGVAFEGLRPASGPGQCEWATESMTGQIGVGFRVPAGFEVYLRILHRPPDTAAWAEVAPQWLESAGTDLPVWPTPDPVSTVEGSMPADQLDLLVPLLRSATSIPRACQFALWNGWGWIGRQPSGAMVVMGGQKPTPWTPDFIAEEQRRQQRRRAAERSRSIEAAFLADCATLDWWGGRTMWLFGGPIDAVASIGGVSDMPWVSEPDGFRRQSPQWCWPDDHAWFLSTEIDDPCTYLAGTRALADAVHSVGLDVIEVARADRW